MGKKNNKYTIRTVNGQKLNLAKPSGRGKFQKIVAQLMRTTDALTRSDIKNWRDAWQWAINVDSPNRRYLYDIYRDVDIDLHLSGCIKQREDFVMAKAFKIEDASGNANDEALHYFRQSWFRQLCRYALDSIFWGHSLIELGDLTTDGDGCPCYNGVRLIPRKYVIPEYGRVITDLGQDWRTGIDYHAAPFTDWLIEAGQPDDLGLFLKAATQTIPKKNMLAFWDTFGEVFGMPMRIGHTTVRDDKELSKMERMMQNMGTEFWALFPEGTEIEVVESTKGDAFNVYDKRVDRANSELSKLVIGQTMTIEDGSSLSQSQTHLEVLQNIIEADADMLEDIVNNQLIPRMVKHGFPLKGLRFAWDDSVDYTPEQQKAYEEMVLQHYDVDPKYFEEKYGMPCEKKELPAMLVPEPPTEPDDEKKKGKKEKDKKQQNARPPFFD